MRAALPQLTQAARVDLALTLAGAKPLARVSCAYREAESVIGALRRLGLHARRWERALRPAVADADDYVVSAVASDETAAPDARAFVFAARDGELAELAARFTDNDVIAGRLLGYPDCCVQAYLAHRDHHHARLEPAFAGDGGAQPYWTNTMLDVFGWHLLSHFPCRADCAASRDQAMRHWEALCRLDPGFGLATARHLRSLVLRHPRLGLVYGQPLADGGLRLLGGSAAFRAALGGAERVSRRPGGLAIGDFAVSGLETFDFTAGSDDVHPV
ncbi:hypothetical protein [Chromobacterium sp. Beijing]|uniref:hypothetical protein n=1 Tax=Chromobacterium sp. Beijing TaxID=2735795 RepID=UPI001F433193|nr:hypothetical protein [Chromobacterium sp. Beijing]UJB31514.1 hypothetical protein HQN78_10840 [Chromobacterium sp. Beijing]